MYISYQKLENAGYNVVPKKGGVEIHSKDPLILDFDAFRELLEPAGLLPYEIDSGLDAFVIEVEMVQIMRAIR